MNIKTNKEIDVRTLHPYHKSQSRDAEEVREFFQRTGSGFYGKDSLFNRTPFFVYQCLRTSVMIKYAKKKKASYLASSVLTSNKTQNEIAKRRYSFALR